eukprot:TRINITY_DN3851_c0_g1_i1.p1 TRINITY_DN3851_c0_g1~~TRINITY_DN3851_c0_g1_i1.p1  ORF type:complete len:370 (+),score=62.61 TRINITY_DN3851_c0_g1_i1:187-1296(+)
MAEVEPFLPKGNTASEDHTSDFPLKQYGFISHTNTYYKARAAAYNMVNGAVDTWFEYGILILIAANVLLFVISTIPVDSSCRKGSQCERLDDHYNTFFESAEFFSVLVFTLEYVLRIWASPENPAFRNRARNNMLGKATALGYPERETDVVVQQTGQQRVADALARDVEVGWGEHAREIVIGARGPHESCWAASVTPRLRQATTFLCIIDLLSVAPYWVSLLPGVPESPDFTTALRLVRLFRLLKADHYVTAFGTLMTVVRENKSLLVAAGVYAVMAWLIASALLYFSEVDNPEFEGKWFQSVPNSLFPTLLMLTGEFPLSNFTPLGQVVAGCVAVFAVAIFAIPTGVLGSGFVRALQMSTGRQFTVDV